MKKSSFQWVFFWQILLVVSIQAQTDVYQQAYRTAMSDSVITPDEQALLNTLQNSLGLTNDAVLETTRNYSSTDDTLRPSLSREGRASAIALAMGYGNGLYGWAIPYVLGSHDYKLYIGMEGVAVAAGFYYAWDKTRELDLPSGRVGFAGAGSAMGILSVIPLASTIGWQRWIDFDPNLKGMLTYAMFAVPISIKYTDRLYQKWKPSDGLTNIMLANLGYGAINGFTIYSLISKTPEEINNPETFMRGISLMTYGGALLGGYFSYQRLHTMNISDGDAAFYNLGGASGFFTAMRLWDFLNIDSYKQTLAVATLSVDVGLYAALKLSQDINLTVGDVRIIYLGGVAGLSLERGIIFLADATDSKASHC